MREIKFRAKQFNNDNDGFQYGSYVTDNKDYHAIIKESKSAPDQMYNILINPKTLGQFTGLQDKNGVDIYEGDILSVINKSFDYTGEPLIIKLGIYEDNEQYVHNRHYGYNLDGIPLDDCIIDGSYIIGNIHENPEFLEGNE